MNCVCKGVLWFTLLGTSSAWAQDNTEWWGVFQDPLLSEAVESALSDNLDLTAAKARGKQANAAVFQQATGSLPQVSLSASSNLAPTDSLGFGMGVELPGTSDGPKTYTSGTARLNASWNVDLFGQNGALVYAADREFKAVKADILNQQLGVAARVTETYWDAVVAQRFLSLAEEQVAAQEGLLESLTLQYSGSSVGALQVLQQRQQVASAKVQIPQRRIQLRIAQQALAVLLGRAPTEVIPVGTGLPSAPQSVSERGLEDAVQKRPDVLAAEKRLQAAKSRQWSAWASALPQVGVTAQTGVQFFDRDSWSSQNVWGAGATVSLPIFTGGRTYGGIRRARGGVLEAVARLHATELSAAQQAQGAWIRDSEQQGLLEAYGEQLQAANQAWTLAREQVLLGLTPYLNAQTVLARKQQAEIAALQGHRDALSARIALIQSLGGVAPQEEVP